MSISSSSGVQSTCHLSVRALLLRRDFSDAGCSFVDNYIYRRPQPARDPCSDRGPVLPLVGSTARKAFSPLATAGYLDAAGCFNAAAGRLRILDACFIGRLRILDACFIIRGVRRKL